MLNKKQKFILLLGIFFVLIACLYPPWEYTFAKPGMTIITQPAGYNYIFSPPSPQNKYFYQFRGVRLDMKRLSIQLLMILAITGGLIAILDKKN